MRDIETTYSHPRRKSAEVRDRARQEKSSPLFECIREPRKADSLVGAWAA